MHLWLNVPKFTSLLQKKAPFSFLPFEMFRNVSNQIILKDSLIRIHWLHTNIIVLICTEVQVKFRFVCLINKVIKMYVLSTSLKPDILRPKSPQRRAKAWTVQKTRHLEKLKSSRYINWSLSPWDWRWTCTTGLKAVWKTKSHFEKRLICTRWSKVCRHKNISPICTCWTFTLKTMSINNKLPPFWEGIPVDVWLRSGSQLMFQCIQKVLNGV